MQVMYLFRTLNKPVENGAKLHQKSCSKCTCGVPDVITAHRKTRYLKNKRKEKSEVIVHRIQ